MSVNFRGSMLPLFLYSISLFVGFVNLLGFRTFPTFYCPPPALDGDFYDFLSMLMVNGYRSVFSEPYFYSPLFLWLKVLLLKIFGDGAYPLKVLSLLVGSSIPVAVFLISKELMANRFYALVPYILSTLYGPLLFFEFQALKTIYGLFFIVWGLYFLVSSHRYALFVSGLFFSMALLIYNNLLVPIALLFLYLLIREKKRALLFLIPTVLVLSFTIYRNYAVSGDMVALSAVGGIHFYIGNTIGSDGLYKRPQGVRPNPFGHYYDALRIASESYGRPVKASEASSFFYKKALEHIKQEPVRWFLLLGKKTLMAFSGREFPNNEDYQYYRERVIFHKYMTFSSYTVFTLGLSGLLLGLFLARDHKYWLVFIFTFSYLFSISIFFIVDRYRLPLALPLLASLVYLLYALMGGLRLKVVSTLTLIFSALLVFYPWKIDTKPRVQEAKIRYAQELCSLKKNIVESKDDESRSLLYTRLADLYLRLGGLEQARYYYKKAYLIDPKNEYAEISYYKLGIFGVVDVEDK